MLVSHDSPWGRHDQITETIYGKTLMKIYEFKFEEGDMTPAEKEKRKLRHDDVSSIYGHSTLLNGTCIPSILPTYHPWKSAMNSSNKDETLRSRCLEW